MTLGAIQYPVGSLEHETGILLMVPGPGADDFPVMGGVAVSAVEAQLKVVAVILFTDPVASLTTGGSPLKHAFLMTISAGYSPMLSNERKIGLVVIDGIPLLFLTSIFCMEEKKQQRKQQALEAQSGCFFGV